MHTSAADRASGAASPTMQAPPPPPLPAARRRLHPTHEWSPDRRVHPPDALDVASAARPDGRPSVIDVRSCLECDRGTPRDAEPAANRPLVHPMQAPAGAKCRRPRPGPCTTPAAAPRGPGATPQRTVGCRHRYQAAGLRRRRRGYRRGGGTHGHRPTRGEGRRAGAEAGTHPANAAQRPPARRCRRVARGRLRRRRPIDPPAHAGDRRDRSSRSTFTLPPRRSIITASESGRIAVHGDTAVAGPGYHRFVGRVLERLGAAVGIEWTDGDGALTFADRPAAERGYLGWLGPQLARARVAARRGERGIHLGLPAGTRYTSDAALVTVARAARRSVAGRGHRRPADRARHHAVVGRRHGRPLSAQPGAVPDVVAGPLARRRRSKARPTCSTKSIDCWRGRIPMDPDARLSVARAGRSLRLTRRRIEDQMARQATPARGLARAGAGPPVGYRRDAVRITHEGWSLADPGFVCASAARPRNGGAAAPVGSITLAATRTGLADGAAMPPRRSSSQFAADLGADALDHRAGDLLGRARLTTDATSGVEIGVLEGYSAVRGSGAAIRSRVRRRGGLAVGRRRPGGRSRRADPIPTAMPSTLAGPWSTADPGSRSRDQTPDARRILAALAGTTVERLESAGPELGVVDPHRGWPA